MGDLYYKHGEPWLLALHLSDLLGRLLQIVLGDLQLQLQLQPLAVGLLGPLLQQDQLLSRVFEVLGPCHREVLLRQDDRLAVRLNRGTLRICHQHG